MKLTQAKVINLHKQKKFDVIHFNKDTGIREGTYAGLNPTKALDEVLRKMSAGYNVVVVPHTKGTSITIQLEVRQKSRVTYNQMLSYQAESLL